MLSIVFSPDDVVHSLSGESIEIVDTDAEGRLLLADVLTLASRKVEVKEINMHLPWKQQQSEEEKKDRKPEPLLVMDFATLTGIGEKIVYGLFAFS